MRRLDHLDELRRQAEVWAFKRGLVVEIVADHVFDVRLDRSDRITVAQRPDGSYVAHLHRVSIGLWKFYETNKGRTKPVTWDEVLLALRRLADRLTKNIEALSRVIADCRTLVGPAGRYRRQRKVLAAANGGEPCDD